MAASETPPSPAAPVLIFEHGSLYNLEGELPADASAVDIERAAIRRPGSDVTLIASVTNLGEHGVDLVHGVIYPPKVVGFGAVRERPWAARRDAQRATDRDRHARR